jgi:hypothetical protein
MREFPEKDWKIFRSKVADWQEAYMDKLVREYIELLGKNANPSDKFWELDKRIKEDKRKAGVQLEMKRSNLLFNLVSLVGEGAIGYDDLEEFSEDLREAVKLYLRDY